MGRASALRVILVAGVVHALAPPVSRGQWRPSRLSPRRAEEAATADGSGRTCEAEDKVFNFDSATLQQVQERELLREEEQTDSNFDKWFWGSAQFDGSAHTLVFENDPRGVILFDGVCNFCDASVNFFMDMDATERGGSFRFAAQQSFIGRTLLQQASGQNPEDLESIVLIKQDGHFFVKAEAVTQIAKELKEPFRTLAFVGELMPDFLKNKIYDFVSSNRGIFGEKNSCRIPDQATRERFL